MAYKWHKTSYPGIRYREHSKRKHGRQPDRYFNVRFQVAGTIVNEGYGWASEGMSASKAALLLAELKEELRTGKGTGKLADRRKAHTEQMEMERREKEVQDKRATTYKTYFHSHYWPDVLQDKKTSALKAEDSLHRNWILPAIGAIPVRNIGELQVKKVSRKMGRAGKAPRSIEYALACIRMVVGHAIRSGYHPGPNPVTTLPRGSRPKYDNKRVRFLTRNEARELLDTLRTRSIAVHNMTLLSLYCGLRAGEIFSLTWGDIDLVYKLITLRNTKNGKTRTLNMPESIRRMFDSLKPGRKSDYVFPGKDGAPRKQMSKTFDRVVNELGFNDGIEDRRQRFTFHNCRHTCASWLVQAGIPLFTVKEIMGHSTIALTERYSHLAPSAFQHAAEVMEQAAEEVREGPRSKVVNITNGLE